MGWHGPSRLSEGYRPESWLWLNVKTASAYRGLFARLVTRGWIWGILMIYFLRKNEEERLQPSSSWRVGPNEARKPPIIIPVPNRIKARALSTCAYKTHRERSIRYGRVHCIIMQSSFMTAFIREFFLGELHNIHGAKSLCPRAPKCIPTKKENSINVYSIRIDVFERCGYVSFCYFKGDTVECVDRFQILYRYLGSRSMCLLIHLRL